MQGWSLCHCPSLRTRRIVDQLGTSVGWLLGEPILEDDAEQTVRVDCPFPSSVFVQELESVLRGTAGTFVAIVPGWPIERVYTGPGAMLSVVYNATEACVASSLGLAAQVRLPDVDLIEALGIPQGDRYFPFGLTPDRRVRRLLPHHFLDLAAFQQVRCWPPTDVRFGAAADPEHVIETIAERLRRTVERIAGSSSIGVAFTAGRDSRMILAATRRLTPRVWCYTVGLLDAKAQQDCRAAAAIARRAGVRHEVIACSPPDPADLDEWQERTGHCVGGRVQQGLGARQRLAEGPRISGMCGEVGRAYYWRRQDLDGGKLSAASLVERLGLPAHPQICLAAEEWLGSLPVSAAPPVLDLLYIEQRLGCWASPKRYGQRRPAMPPMSDDQLFEAMLSLPCDYRFEQRLVPDVIERLWPELLAYPFNEELGIRRLATSLRKRGGNAYRALRNIRSQSMRASNN
jgi:hypothetical protein